MLQESIGFNRRQFIKQTAASSTGALAFLPALQAAQTLSNTSIKNCIFLFLTGGPSQIDTFDPKPEASSAIRGPFKPIASKVPGTFFAETLPLIASRADKFTLIRSLFQNEAPFTKQVCN